MDRQGGRLASHMPVVDLDTAVNRDKRERHPPDVAPLPAGTRCDGSGADAVRNARWCADPLPDHTLNRIGKHGEATVFHGTIKDGVGREKVVEWLRWQCSGMGHWVPWPANPSQTSYRLHHQRPCLNGSLHFR